MNEHDILFTWTMLLSLRLYLRTRKRIIKKRRYKVRPMNRRRHLMGQYEYLVTFMKRNDHDQFFKYTRLTIEQYECLLWLVGPKLQKARNRNPLSPGHRLTMTLHFLSQGSSMQEIAWSYHIGKSTVHYVIKETCNILWDTLSPIYIPQPKRMDWEKTRKGFYNRWNMPNCLGAIDGKHVAIQAPKHSGSEFFSYKKSFSIVLMAACDAYYKFTMVDIGGAGSNHDSTIFRESAFGNVLMNDHLNPLELPEDCCLPSTNILLPCYFIADQAFPLHKRIMRPYPGERLSDIKNIFNYRLSRARRTIENTFGILIQRWRVFRRTIVGDITTCEQIVKAAVVLHNFVQRSEDQIPISERKYCPTGYVDYYDENGQLHLGKWREEGNTLPPVGRLGSNNASRYVQCIRDHIAKYFITAEGGLSWQYKYIKLGCKEN